MLLFRGYQQDFRPLIRCQIWKASQSSHVDAIALLDTGATDCTVRAGLASALGLEVHGHIHTHNVGGAGLKPVTRIDLILFGNDAVNAPIKHAVTDARTFIDEFDPTADVIIGMNVLRLFKLEIDAGVPSLVLT